MNHKWIRLTLAVDADGGDAYLQTETILTFYDGPPPAGYKNVGIVLVEAPTPIPFYVKETAKQIRDILAVAEGDKYQGPMLPPGTALDDPIPPWARRKIDEAKASSTGEAFRYMADLKTWQERAAALIDRAAIELRGSQYRAPEQGGQSLNIQTVKDIIHHAERKPKEPGGRR